MSRRASDPPSTTRTKRGVRRTRPNAQEHAHTPPTEPAHPSPRAGQAGHRSSRTAQEWYRAEKERRGASADQELIAEARREYLALLASEAGGPKGGRPRKAGRPRKVATTQGSEFEDVSEFEAGDEGEDSLHTSVEKL